MSIDNAALALFESLVLILKIMLTVVLQMKYQVRNDEAGVPFFNFALKVFSINLKMIFEAKLIFGIDACFCTQNLALELVPLTNFNWLNCFHL